MYAESILRVSAQSMSSVSSRQHRNAQSHPSSSFPENAADAEDNMQVWRMKSPCNGSVEGFDDIVKNGDSTEVPHGPSNDSGSASASSHCSVDEDSVGPRLTKAEAQNKLLAIAKIATTLYGGRGKGIKKDINAEHAEISPDQLNDETLPCIATAAEHISFMSRLKNEGIEVLKLGRRSKWQQRTLTVSEETIRSRQDSAPDDSWQCPQSLLWLKQFDGKPKSLTGIRKDGRGGLNFATLRQVHCSLESTTLPSVPRSLKAKFPALYGVVLTYRYGTERDKTVTFVFKCQAEASEFTAAIEAARSIAGEIA